MSLPWDGKQTFAISTDKTFAVSWEDFFYWNSYTVIGLSVLVEGLPHLQSLDGAEFPNDDTLYTIHLKMKNL